MRKEDYRSVRIRKSALAALESTGVRLSLRALEILHSRIMAHCPEIRPTGISGYRVKRAEMNLRKLIIQMIGR